MRPVDKGAAPDSYSDYEDAKQDLVNRLGSYCSYCERRIVTQLAVEHIQPKDLPQYAHLICDWCNFLLACVNCNSAKGKSDFDCVKHALPDRDNTFAAFIYAENGWVKTHPALTAEQRRIAEAILERTGLNRFDHPDWDESVRFSALERLSQRMQAWRQAKEARLDFETGKAWAGAIGREAASLGFFSIWMAAFEGIPEVRRELFKVFAGTAPDCFDALTGEAKTPRPPNGLSHAGKI